MARADDHRTEGARPGTTTRRRFLTGAAAAGVALPVLGAWGPPACEPNLPPLPPEPARRAVLAGRGLGRSPPRPGGAVDPAGAGPARRRRHARRPVPVRWEVADDDDFGDLVCHGRRRGRRPLGPTRCTSTWPGCARAGGTSYRFVVGDQVSPVGRTRTAPAAGRGGGALRFLFASCQNWQSGYWPLWAQRPRRRARRRAPPRRLHLRGRHQRRRRPPPQQRRDRDLAAYRNRYGLYKGDPALQARPRRLPVDRHVGRPRGREQLRRPRGAGPDRGRPTSRPGGPPPTRPGGSTCRCVCCRLGTDTADLPPVRLGTLARFHVARHPPVPRPTRRAAAASAPRAPTARRPGAPCSGPTRRRGWPRAWPSPPPPGTSSPTRS